MVVLNFFILKHCSPIVTQILITASVVRVKVVSSFKVHTATSLTAVTGVAENALKHWSETSSRTWLGEPRSHSLSLCSTEETCHSALQIFRWMQGSVTPALQPTSSSAEAGCEKCLHGQRSHYGLRWELTSWNAEVLQGLVIWTRSLEQFKGLTKVSIS